MIDNKKTILIVDDTETNIDILLELLGNTYDILVALDGQSAIEITREDSSIDLILLDIMMPNMNGYEVCRVLKTMETIKEIPIVFITAKTDEDSIEMAYDVGGIDYITKPFKPRELLARIKTQLKLSELVKHLKYISYYDEMTGIYNRRKFFALASKMFDENRDNLFAVMIDIDKFKNVNDTYGHPVGDKIIKAVTQSISKSIHQNSIFGRIGGEEFAILCNCIDRGDVFAKIEFMRQEVEKLEVFTEKGELVQCTISEGIAFISEDITTIDSLLKEADLALYEAKGTGRNRTIFR